MPRADDAPGLIEVDGLKIPKAALEEAEKVIFGWERGSSYRADKEVVRIYKIIASAVAQKVRKKPRA